MEFDHRLQIRAAQVQLLFEQLPSALLATIVNAAILIAILWRHVSQPVSIAWMLAVVLVACVRYGHRRLYFRSSSSQSESRRWGRHYLYGVAVNGVLWGFASYFFFTPESYVHQVFLAFVLMGMASGGISTLSALPEAYLLFIVPALLPYGVQLVKSGGELHFAMAVMMVVYISMMGTIGHRLYSTGEESLRLRFENLELLQETDAAQDALQRSYAELEQRVEERTADLAKSEDALRHADKRKDEFLAMLGHELRNPLAPIRNALQIMRRPGVPDYTIKWAQEVIDRQVDRLTRLVDDLLDVSRIVYGKISLRETLLDVSGVVNHAVEGSLPFIEGRRQKLSMHIPKDSPWVKGDPVRLEQVVSNLLNNAAKYSEAGEQIDVFVSAVPDWVTVKIQDHGIGISPEVMPYIFELFAQANHTLARTQGGLGIGLTVVKRLVEMHGGHVEAHSEGLGSGSTFTLSLPRQAPPVQTESKMRSIDENARSEDPIRILVVDDNQDAVESLAMLLDLDGYTVATACDGITGLAEAERFNPDVILLDIGMPGMDGYEVARELRAKEQTKSAIIIALTGYGQPDDRARAEAAGFTDHLTKPVNPDVLNSVLKSHLNAR